jgi:hypothetical protein
MPTVGRSADPDASSHVQSVIFNKDLWDESRAREWLEDHGFFVDGLDETSTSYRFRQVDPDSERFNYRNDSDDLPEGVTFVIGIPK